MSPPNYSRQFNHPGIPQQSTGSGLWSTDFDPRRGGNLSFQSTSNLAGPSGGGCNTTCPPNNHSHHPPGPPPLPPRPDQQRGGGFPFGLQRSFPPALGYGGYNSYSPSTYSSGLYGGYNNYGGYHRLGGDYGSLSQDGLGGGGDHFIRMAEESSRQAFQSIESIVQAFGSVNMMLESTYHAVYSSFRAVIGVADHFSRLRDHLSQIISTLAVVRTLHWLFRKALYALGLSRQNPSSEGAWSAASRATLENLSELDLKRSRSSWPILMFLGVAFGAPWLIWRLLASVARNKISSEKWMTREDPHYIATALYDFQGDNSKEVSFKAGQKIILAPKVLQPKIRGWLLGSSDGKQVGLLPADYLKIQGLSQGLRGLSTKVGEETTENN